MKKTILLTMLVLMFILTVPVAAAHFQPVGERFYLNNWDDGWCELMPEGPPSYIGETTLPANTPFHVRHGWQLDWLHEFPPDLLQEYAAIIAQTHRWTFGLKVDGETVAPSGRWRFVDQEIDMQYWINIFNFDEGMTGTHEFQGTYYYRLEANEIVTIVCTVEVTFTE